MVTAEELKKVQRKLRIARRKHFKPERFKKAIPRLSKKLNEVKLELQDEILNSDAFFEELINDQPQLSQIFGTLELEESYSRCLGWLLSPERDSNFNEIFLKIIIENYPDIFESKNGIDPLKSFEVEVEHTIEAGRADLLLKSETQNFIILIENKILAGTKEGTDEIDEEDKLETINQLEKYKDWLAKKQEFDSKNLVFLCRDIEQKKTNMDDLESDDVNFLVKTWEQLIFKIKKLNNEIKISSKNERVIFEMFLRDIIRFVSEVLNYKDDLKLINESALKNRVPEVPLSNLKKINRKIGDDLDAPRTSRG